MTENRAGRASRAERATFEAVVQRRDESHGASRPAVPLAAVQTKAHPAQGRAEQGRVEALERQVQFYQAAASEARALFRDAPHAAFLLSPGGRLLEVNARGAALLGSVPPLLKGRPLEAILRPVCPAGPARQATLTGLVAAAFRERHRQTGEVQVQRSDGQRLVLSLEAALCFGRDGAPVCQLSVFDLTASRTPLPPREEAGSLGAPFCPEALGRKLLASEQEFCQTLSEARRALSRLCRKDEDAADRRALIDADAALLRAQGQLETLQVWRRVRSLQAQGEAPP